MTASSAIEHRIRFEHGQITIVEGKAAFTPRFALSGYAARITFGTMRDVEDMLGMLDATTGSGEGGFGGDDFWRFDPGTGDLVGGSFDVPLAALRCGDLPSKMADTQQGRVHTQDPRLSVPQCTYAVLDLQQKIILCSHDAGFIPNGRTQFLGVSEGLNLLVEDGRYKGFLLLDPLRWVTDGNHPTEAIDYEVLHALFWPHRDTVFAHGFDDDDDALIAYYRGLKTSLGAYLSGRRPVQRAIGLAIDNAILDPS